MDYEQEGTFEYNPEPEMPDWDDLHAGSGDEPPDMLLDSLIHEYGQTGLLELNDTMTVFDIPPDPPQALDYGIDLVQTETGQMAVEFVKEVEGGLRYGGMEDRATISVHNDPAEAISIAQDLTSLRDEVWELTNGDITAGWQAMASMAYEIGTGTGQIQEGEALFARTDLPSDPFELMPAEAMLAQYEALSRDTDIQEQAVNQDVSVSMDLLETGPMSDIPPTR